MSESEKNEVSRLINEISAATAAGPAATADLAGWIHGERKFNSATATELANRWASGWACWAAHANFGNNQSPWK